MGYTRIVWQNKETGGTKLNAENLNKMDIGIYENSDNIESLKTRTSNIETTLNNKLTAIESYLSSIGGGAINATDVIYDSKSILNVDATADAFISYLISKGKNSFYLIDKYEYDNLVEDTINPPVDDNGDPIDADTIDDDQYYLITDMEQIVGFKKGMDDITIPATSITYFNGVDASIQTVEDGLSYLTDLNNSISTDVNNSLKLGTDDKLFVDILSAEYTNDKVSSIQTIKDALDYLIDAVNGGTP